MMEFLDEASKQELERAWRHAVLQKMDPKKFPKKPELLWDRSAGDQTELQMAKMALFLASNGKDFKKTLPKKLH